MACYCPHIRCFDCNNYGHVAADCPDKIPPSGTPACTAETTPPVDVTDHHLGIIATPGISNHDYRDRHRFSCSQSCTHITLDTGVTATMTPTRVTPDHFIDPHIIAVHTTGAPAHICYCCTTHHIADPHHAGISPQDDSRSRMHKSHKYHYKPTQRSSSQFTVHTLEAS